MGTMEKAILRTSWTRAGTKEICMNDIKYTENLQPMLEYKYGSASLSATGNIEILPADFSQQVRIFREDNLN
jgi:hypothetical protein